jgi:hypothetical protein
LLRAHSTVRAVITLPSVERREMPVHASAVTQPTSRVVRLAAIPRQPASGERAGVTLVCQGGAGTSPPRTTEPAPEGIVAVRTLLCK